MFQRSDASPLGFTLDALEPRQLLSVLFDSGPALPGADGSQAVLADIDDDGLLDIVDSGDGMAGSVPRGLGFFRNLGGGNFAPRQQLTDKSLTGIVPGDFDGDGRTDLYGTRFSGGAFESVILFNRGVMGLQVSIQPDLLGDRQALFANDDNLPDLVALDPNGFVRIATANPANGGNLVVTATIPVSAGTSTTLQIGNVNGDQFEDLLVRAADGGRTLLIGQGNGQFTTSPTSLPAGDWNFVDYNSDGHADLWRREGSRLVIRLNESGPPPGSFLFGPEQEVFRSTTYNPTGFTSDLDGDNRPELLSALVGSRQVVTYVHSSDSNGHYTIFGDSLSSFDRFTMTLSRDIGDLNGDGRADFISTVRGITGGFSTGIRFSRVVTDPAVVQFIAPAQIIADGRLFLQARIDPATDSPARIVRFFVDSNNNGFLDDADLFIGPSTTRDDSGLRNYFGNLPDGVELGSTRLFAVANGLGPAAAAEVAIWTRSYHPGVTRSDGRLHQSVTIFNPTNAPVDYRLNAQYQSGQLRGLIAQGRLGPGRTATITIINPAKPAANRVRAGAPFALELQSTDHLAAVLHTTDTRIGGSAADAFLSDGLPQWAISDVNRGRNDTITLYNPSLNPAVISIELFNAQGQGVTRAFTLVAGRRTSVSIRELANQFSFTPRQAIIRSTPTSHGQVPIVAGLFSAEPTSGRLIARTASPLSSDPQYGGGLLLGPDHRSLITLQNPTSDEREVTLRIAYTGATPGVVVRSYILPARQQLTLDAGALVPDTARFAFASTNTGPLSIRVVPRADGDVAGLSSTTTETDWTFAGLQLSRRTATTGAGRTQFETLFLANAHNTRQTITLTFALPGGRTETRQFTLQPGRSRIVQLHAQSFFAETGGRYSLRVSAPQAIAAAVLHRDAAGQWLHSGAAIPAT